MFVLLKPEDLVHLRIVSSPIISRGGDRVFVTLTRMDLDRDVYETNIWVYELSSRKFYGLTSGPQDFSPEPSPNGDLLVFLSRRGFGEKERGIALYALDLESSREPWLIRRFKNNVQFIDWRPNNRELAIVVSEGEPEEDVKHIEDLPVWFNGIGFTYNLSSNIYVIDVYSGEYHRVTEGKHFIRSIAWSRSGRYIAYLVSKNRAHPYLTELHIYDIESGEDRRILENIVSYFPIAWSPDDKYLALIYHRRERGFSTHYKVYVVDSETGEEQCITCRLDRNAVNMMNSDVRATSNARNIYWSKTGYIYFLVSDRGRNILARAKPGGEIEFIVDEKEFVVDEFSVSDNDVVAFLGMTPYAPRELYLWSNGGISKLTNVNEFYLSKIKLGKVEYFSFKASDGVDIDAWIMYPRKLPENKRLPMILYIHGGPKTSYGWSFIEEFHYLVNNGYAILYMNPRGSDGYSQEFADIRGHYGERDYMDLMEGVEEAIKRYSFIDSEKIGVAGGSYGGFMVNWIITHTNKFKAAVTQRSICDWISMYGTTDIGHYFVEDQIKCTPWKNPEVCLEKSPLKYIGNARTPTLIIHSDQDYRCWLDQALMLYKALKLNNVDTRLVIFPGENHDLSRRGKPKHRIERLKEIKEWFDKYLKKTSEEEKQEKSSQSSN